MLSTFRSRFVAICAATLFATALSASAQEAATKMPITENYKAMVAKLVQFSGGEMLGQQMAYGAAQEALVSLSGAGLEVTEEIQKIVLDLAIEDFGAQYSDIDFLAELYAPLYAEHLNEKELTELLTFYESPIGQKSLTALPAVGQAAVQTLREATVKGLPAYEERIMSKLREAGIVTGE